MIADLAIVAGRIERLREDSLALATALAPHIGYDAAAALVKDAYVSGRTVREVAAERSGLSEADLAVRAVGDAQDGYDAPVDGGRVPEARALLDRTLPLAAGVGGPVAACRAHLDLGRALVRTRDMEGAALMCRPTSSTRPFWSMIGFAT